MPGEPPFAVALALTLVVVAGTRAQERHPATGTVHAAWGARQPGAKVVLVGAPWFATPGTRDDLVEVTTDENGRFTAGLRAEYVYSVWATCPGNSGGYAFTEVHQAVAAGARLRLDLCLPVPTPIVQLTGFDAWAREGAPRLVARSPDHARESTFGPGKAAPPWPLPFEVLVVDRDRAPIVRSVIDPDVLRGDPKGHYRLEVAPPHDLVVRVVNEKDEAVAGAEIWQSPWSPGVWSSRAPLRQDLPGWRRIGTTDVRGDAKVQVPVVVGDSKALTPVALEVRATGFAHLPAGIAAKGPPYCGDTELQVPADHSLTVKLRPRGWFEVRGETDRQLLLATRITSRGGSLLHVEDPVQSGPRELPYPAVLLTPGMLVGRPTAADRAWLFAPAVRDAAGLRAEPTGRRVTVRATAADGTPLRFGLVTMRCAKIGIDVPLFLDDAGRGEVLLGEGTWTFVTCAGEEMAVASLADKGEPTIELRTATVASTIVRFVDAAGQPMRYARVPLRLSFGSQSGDRSRSPWDPTPDAALEQVWMELCPSGPARSQQHGAPLQADRNGEVRIVLPPASILTVTAYSGGDPAALIPGGAGARHYPLTADQHVDILVTETGR